MSADQIKLLIKLLFKANKCGPLAIAAAIGIFVEEGGAKQFGMTRESKIVSSPQCPLVCSQICHVYRFAKGEAVGPVELAVSLRTISPYVKTGIKSVACFEMPV